MAEVKTIGTPEQAANQLKAQNIFMCLDEAQKNYIFELYEAKTKSRKQKDRDHYANKLYGVMNFLACNQTEGVSDCLDTIIFDYCIKRHYKEGSNND